jgi:hypothetical protein
VVAGQRAGARGQRHSARAARLAEDAQAGVLRRAQAVLVAVADELVLAEAEERVVAVVHPGQELGGLRASSRSTPGGGSRSSAISSCARARIAASLDGRRHLAHDVEQPQAQALELGRPGDAVDLDVDARLRDLALVLRASACEHLGEVAGGVAHDPHDRVDEEWMPDPRAPSSIVVESTRNGMSSLTISTTVCGEVQRAARTPGCRRGPSASRRVRGARSAKWARPAP